MVTADTPDLKPGALVWEPATQHMAVLSTADIQDGFFFDHADPETRVVDLSDMPANGWEPVGVDGTIPEGCRLAVVTDEMHRTAKAFSPPYARLNGASDE